MMHIDTIEYARQLDQEDPLSVFREEFYSGEENIIYLDGNSLGRLPRQTKSRIGKVVEKEWGDERITLEDGRGHVYRLSNYPTVGVSGSRSGRILLGLNVGFRHHSLAIDFRHHTRGDAGSGSCHNPALFPLASLRANSYWPRSSGVRS